MDNLEKLTEKNLLTLLKKGNQMAFTVLYNRHWKQMFGYAFNIVNDKQLAQNVVHEVFIKIWNNKEASTISNLGGYLRLAIRNESISLLRKVNFDVFDELVISGLYQIPDVETNNNYLDLKIKIEAIVQKLPTRCREIFYLSRYQDYTNKEIAKHFNISNRTVENQLSLALKHVRSTLGPMLLLMLSLLP